MWYRLKENTGDESKLYILDLKMKLKVHTIAFNLKIFHFMAYLINETEITYRNFKIIHIIETLQTLFFIINAVESNPYNNSVVSMVMNATQYITVSH